MSCCQRIDVTFREEDQHFDVQFEAIQNVSDGGYERGYKEGYTEGVQKGYADGLAARQYETWKITYVDGTVEEKQVALL